MIDATHSDIKKLASIYVSAYQEAATRRTLAAQADNAAATAETKRNRAAEELRKKFEGIRMDQNIAIDTGGGYLVIVGSGGVPIGIASLYGAGGDEMKIVAVDEKIVRPLIDAIALHVHFMRSRPLTNEEIEQADGLQMFASCVVAANVAPSDPIEAVKKLVGRYGVESDALVKDLVAWASMLKVATRSQESAAGVAVDDIVRHHADLLVQALQSSLADFQVSFAEAIRSACRETLKRVESTKD